MLKILDWTALILLVIAGLNSGIIGLLNYDPIIDFFYDSLIVAHSFFFLVGIAAIYIIFRMSQVLKRFIGETFH